MPWESKEGRRKRWLDNTFVLDGEQRRRSSTLRVVRPCRNFFETKSREFREEPLTKKNSKAMQRLLSFLLFLSMCFSPQEILHFQRLEEFKGENCTLFAPRKHMRVKAALMTLLSTSLSYSSSSSFFFYFQIMGRVNFSAAASASLKLLWASAALSRSRLRCGDGQQLFPVINCNSHRHLSQASAPNHWITFRTTRTF